MANVFEEIGWGIEKPKLPKPKARKVARPAWEREPKFKKKLRRKIRRFGTKVAGPRVRSKVKKRIVRSGRVIADKTRAAASKVRWAYKEAREEALKKKKKKNLQRFSSNRRSIVTKNGMIMP